MKRFSYYVYILLCNDGSYYVGVTNEYLRRLRQHQEGMHPTSYTFTRRPVTLVYVAEFNDVHEVIAWEHRVKRWSRKKKEALILGDQQALEWYAKRSGVRKRANKTSPQ